MTQDGSVNSQITDSISQTVALLTGQAPAQSMGMLDAVLVETLGIAMHNAVMRQQNGQMVTSAALTAACAKMLQTPIGLIKPPPAPPPAPPPPPPAPPPPSPTPSPSTLSSLTPLVPTCPPVDPAAALAQANLDAQVALQKLIDAQSAAEKTAQTAQSDLAKLAAKASGASPAPPTPPEPPMPPMPPPPVPQTQANVMLQSSPMVTEPRNALKKLDNEVRQGAQTAEASFKAKAATDAQNAAAAAKEDVRQAEASLASKAAADVRSVVQNVEQDLHAAEKRLVEGVGKLI